MTLDCGASQEINRLRIDPQEAFHFKAQLGIVATRVIQKIGAVTVGAPIQGRMKDRLELGWGVNGVTPVGTDSSFSATRSDRTPQTLRRFFS